VNLNQGDIISLDFNPQAGYEQKGRRLAIIVSNITFNKYSRTVMVCPVTQTDKNHPFHVRLNDETKTSGVVLCDQLKTLDIIARGYDFIEKAPKHIVDEIINIINNFIEPEN